MRLAVRALPALALLAAMGCANATFDFAGKQNALEEAQRRYTELVRWGEIEGASAYVDPSLSADFLLEADRLRDIRFTDFESGPLRFGDDSQTATVEVVYHAYSVKTLVEKRFREHQVWYREASAGNGWRVRPNLDAIAHGLNISH